nr:unnamed protein product [Digitaria exilis]
MAGEENGDEGWRRSGIEVSALQFGYDGQPPLFARFNLRIAPGSRCLLVGANGSAMALFGWLRCSWWWGADGKQLSQGDVPLQGDFSAEHMIFGGTFGESYPHGYLWVTIYHNTKFVMASRLLKPSQVLLLDEITVDLDVVTRMDLLDFFKEECEQREATIVYATHIFDGLETWATDIAYIQEGELRKSVKYSDVEELKSAKNLLSVVESWLRSETKLPKKDPPCSETQPRRSSPFDNSPFRSSRHMAYYR